MAIMLRLGSAVTFSLLFALAAAGQSLSAESWAQGLHSRARLMAGGQHGDRWLAGVAIVLDPGFKTYWREPGESGLPPRFDWSGSDNVAAVEIRWPAPTRYEDAAGVAHIYSGTVVLPVVVTAADASKPVTLAVAADYGICKEICIPAHAELRATLSGEAPDRAAIAEALARVPRPQALGAAAELSVLSVAPLDGGKPGLSVTIRAPAGAKPVLFAEGPENWFLSASLPDGSNRVAVAVEEKPKDASGPIPVRLTVVAGDSAIETDVSLDAGGPPR